MYFSTNVSKEKVKKLTEDIMTKSLEIVVNNSNLIKQKYPLINDEEAQIISSYNCVSYDPNYNPYKILNQNLCEENRYEGIKNISKYFYIFLRALRKLDRYFPKEKYLYKCIDKKVLLNNYYNEKRIIYKRGSTKIFWGFTSFSKLIRKSYFIGDDERNIEEGTIFTIYGDIWGYDISLFNSVMEEEIILEPEQKFIVVNAIPPIKNKFINIRLKCENYNNIIEFNELFENNIYENVNKQYSIKIVYKLPHIDEIDYINIFGEKFIKNNSKYCKFIYKYKEYSLQKSFYISDIIGDFLEIILIGFEKLNNLCEMFSNCEYLYSIENIYISSKVSDVNKMFYGCGSLVSLPDILSLWNTSNINDMSYMFYGCSSLKFFPDISKWNISKVTNISYMFSGCKQLLSLPELFMWNISKIENMESLFENCYSLIKLPNISKWNISNVQSMKSLFSNCHSLISLPDISKWDISNITQISSIFEGCKKLRTLPDISQWDVSKVKLMNSIFNGCLSLIYLPDISKWNTSNVIEMNSIFYGCSSLSSLPDISKWDISNVENMSNMFEGCSSLITLPDIIKWNISKVENMSHIFEGCPLLNTLPDISIWNTSKVRNMSYIFERCLFYLIYQNGIHLMFMI